MRVSLTNAVPKIYEIFNESALTISAFPDAASTLLVEFTVSSEADIKAGVALFQVWGKGPITAATTDFFPAPISALRLSATAGTGTIEYLGLRDDK